MLSFPPKRILVAFDFSERALRAWKYARDLANRFGCKLDAVYVAPPPPIAAEGALPAPLSTQERAELARELRRALEDVDEVYVREGDVADGVIRTAQQARAGLIVLGTVGVTGLRRLVRASQAAEVARRSPIPVLVVHGDTRLPRSVLAPVNMAPYSLRGFSFAKKVAEALGAKVTLFNVAEDVRGAARERRDLALAAGRRLSPVSVEIKVVGGRPLEQIVEEAVRHELVVLAVHRKGGWLGSALGTTAENVLRRSQTPVLCVPPAPRRAVRGVKGAGRRTRRASSPRAARRSPGTISARAGVR